jgi:hypothetical protein
MNNLQINRLSEESKSLAFLYFSFGTITILIGLHYLFLQAPAWHDTATGILFAIIGTVITSVGLIFNRNNIIEINSERVVIDMLFLGRVKLNWTNIKSVEIKRATLVFTTQDGKTSTIKLFWLGSRLGNKIKTIVAKFAQSNHVEIFQKNQPLLVNA